jgi:acyl-coenzyme A synthetase/AMP-(fatty) acid ligase
VIATKRSAPTTPSAMSPYWNTMYPRQLEIVDEVPKTVTGKFLRRVLRDREPAKG